MKISSIEQAVSPYEATPISLARVSRREKRRVRVWGRAWWRGRRNRSSRPRRSSRLAFGTRLWGREEGGGERGGRRGNRRMGEGRGEGGGERGGRRGNRRMGEGRGEGGGERGGRRGNRRMGEGRGEGEQGRGGRRGAGEYVVLVVDALYFAECFCLLYMYTYLYELSDHCCVFETTKTHPGPIMLLPRL